MKPFSKVALIICHPANTKAVSHLCTNCCLKDYHHNLLVGMRQSSHSSFYLHFLVPALFTLAAISCAHWPFVYLLFLRICLNFCSFIVGLSILLRTHYILDISLLWNNHLSHLSFSFWQSIFTFIHFECVRVCLSVCEHAYACMYLHMTLCTVEVQGPLFVVDFLLLIYE